MLGTYYFVSEDRFGNRFHSTPEEAVAATRNRQHSCPTDHANEEWLIGKQASERIPMDSVPTTIQAASARRARRHPIYFTASCPKPPAPNEAALLY